MHSPARTILLVGCLIWLVPSNSIGFAQGNSLPRVAHVEAQPLSVHARQIIETLDFTGTPLPPADRLALEATLRRDNDADVVAGVQEILDKRCLLGVHINPESRVKVAAEPVQPTLLEQGWTQFLVKVHNEAGVTAELKVSSPQAGPVYRTEYPEPTEKFSRVEIRDRWCEVKMFNGRPVQETLSGLELSVSAQIMAPSG